MSLMPEKLATMLIGRDTFWTGAGEPSARITPSRRGLPSIARCLTQGSILNGLFPKKNVHRILAHDGFERSKSKIEKIHSAEQMFSCAQQHRCKSQVPLVDQPHRQILTNRRHSATNAHVPAPGCLFGVTQCRHDAIRDEVERRPTLHHERRTRMVSEHKYWRVVGRIRAPPSLPRIVFPSAAKRPKHV